MFALALYWPVLKMPLIYDTLLHLRIAEGLNWRNVWLPTEAFGFYRPMTFTPILFTRTLFGNDPAWFYNAMNLAQHALNASFLYLFTYNLSSSSHANSSTNPSYRSLVTALLFAAFPFSYQALAVYGHNVHPAVTGAILLGLLTSMSKEKRWQATTPIIFVIGLLTHESFILFGVLGALIQFLKSNAAALRSRVLATRPYWIYIALGTVYIVVYQFLPISRAPQGDDAVGALWTKLLYVMQGSSHPFALIAKRTLFSAETIILAVFILTLLLSLWRRAWLGLVGWGWWLLASALVVLPLPTGYLLNGPRLLYLGSVGVALIWATILAPSNVKIHLTNNPSFINGWKTIIRTVGLVALLIANMLFVRDRLSDYAELTQGIEVLRQERHEGIVLLNHPQWLAPERNVYPLGAEFAQQLGDYLFIEEWTTRNLKNNPQSWGFRVDELLTTVPYGYGVHAQHSLGEWEPVESDWFLTRYTEQETHFEPVGGIAPPSEEVLARFEPYRLVSASADYCPPHITIRSRWHNNDPAASSTLSLFVQLLDQNGALIGQNDAPPLRMRPDRLPNGVYDVLDERAILAESGNPTIVLLGVYDYTTGERMEGFSADGTPLPDNALRLKLDACQ